MKFRNRYFGLMIFGMFCLACGSVFGQFEPTAGRPLGGSQVFDSLVTILQDAEGQPREIGSGVILRSDGLILTAYHLVKDARRVQVKLRNGEIFDAAEPVAYDQRRNIALLRISATGLPPLPAVTSEEGAVGSRVFVVSGGAGEAANASAGILSSVSLADEIRGAGQGFRVLRFTAPTSSHSTGALLVDERGRALGMVTALPQAENQSYAVPLSSVIGLARSVNGNTWVIPTIGTLTLSPALASATPVPIPQRDVLVPQRPVSPLQPRGPGSVVVKPSRPVDVLLASKTIFVDSRTMHFKPEQLINELRKKSELDNWGLVFVDDQQVADLVLTIDHLVLTYKFTFSMAHQRTGVVVATGSVIIWDGNLGAPRMADRVIEKLMTVRAQTPTPK